MSTLLSTEMKKRLKEIRERVEAAAPGPWRIEPRNMKYYDEIMHAPIVKHEDCINDEDDFLGAHFIGIPQPGRGDMLVPDAWFVSNAREDVPWLLDVIHRLLLEAGEND
jgi:hypothetical protein